MTTRVYDADQSLTDVTDPDTRHTTTAYDGENNPILVTRPDSTTQATSYDDDGNMLNQTDGLGKLTQYGHDGLDRQIWAYDPLGRLTSTGYDAAGNPTSLTQPGTGATTLTATRTFDAANQLKTISYSDGTTHSVAYTYDDDGQRASMVDGTGTTTYTVDSLHRVTQVVNGAGAVVKYGYDLDGRTTKLTYPGGTNQVTRGFDDAARLTTVADWLSHTTTFRYDDDSNIDKITYPNTVIGTRTYDNADQVLIMKYAVGTTPVLSKYTYTHTDGGLLASALPNNGAPGITSTYAYDTNGRLNSTAGSGSTNKWIYDSADQMTKNPAGTVQAYDPAGQVTSAAPTSGSATTYGYDNRGDRTSSKVGTATATTYTYDQAGDMTGYTPPTGTAYTYGYDGDGTRTSRKAGTASATPFTWDPTTSLLLTDGTSQFIYGPDGVPLEQIRGTTPTYLHADQLGSTVLITTQAGATADTYAYDPYGKVTSHAGTATTQLQFNGQYADAETGYIYLRARMYDPATGQFVSGDPIAASTRSPYG